MSRRSPLAVVATALLMLAAVLANPAQASASSSVLVDIRAGSHRGFDRIVFEFDGPVPAHASARWADVVRRDDTGTPWNLHGEAFIEVTMHDVVTRGGDRRRPLTYTSPERSLALPNLNHLVSDGAYEGHMTVGLGLMQRTRILRAFTLTAPSRYVVDVSNDFPRRWAPVYFLPNPGTDWFDRVLPPNYTSPEGTALHRVLRTVPWPGVARGQLHRFFAGPTDPELLSTVFGGASADGHLAGFRSVRVEDGVAHVTLRHTCRRFGWEPGIPEVTQLTPSLKHWPTVDRVKVYDARGRTSRPSGHTDSGPPCVIVPD